MTRAAIVTRWTGNGLSFETRFRPALFAEDFVLPTGENWTDATAQPNENLPPQPNILIVEVNCSDATLAAIKAHAQYGNAAVLWEGDLAQSPVMTTTAYNVLVTFLANKFGVTQTAVRNVLDSIGAVVDGVQTRYDFAVKIIGYLRTRPKAAAPKVQVAADVAVDAVPAVPGKAQRAIPWRFVLVTAASAAIEAAAIIWWWWFR